MAARNAAEKLGSDFRNSSMRCGMTSVSVSLGKRCPLACRVARSAAWFSMIPLWMTAILPAQSTCGWALASVGAPWVAQRVWAMPD